MKRTIMPSRCHDGASPTFNFGTVPSSHLRGIGLNLVTVAASHDEARTGQPRPSMSINRLGI
jgi:hypothetical protein